MTRPHADRTDDRLADYFTGATEPADVSAIFPLQQARSPIQAMQALFGGTEAAVIVRLLVLREVGGRGEHPFWTAAELRTRFPYLAESKLENVIGHLRERDLLAWDPETSRYSLSPLARMVISALGVLFRLGNEGSELGYIAGQLAASSISGRVSEEDLQHLLSRLTELKDEFERAILSGSESRIRAAEAKFKSAMRWVDKGSEVLERIQQSELDGSAHRVAQKIGLAQSELLRMSGAFQRALNRLESQKVHLGATGLSSSDVTHWLRGLDLPHLRDLASGAVAPVLKFEFVLGDVALDIAEYELIDRQRPERMHVPLPPAVDAASVDGVEIEQPDWQHLQEWNAELSTATEGSALEHAVPRGDYTRSSYRLSLLGLLGDAESASVEGPLADFAKLECRPAWTGQVASVGRDGVAEMSAGHIEHGDSVRRRTRGS
jgi:hypothetical protein